MIYDDLNKCSLEDLLLLIEKLREKLSVAKDRIVMLEAEADAQFLYFSEAQEELEILRSKNARTISIYEGLLTEVNEIKKHLPVSMLNKVSGLEAEFEKLYPEWEGLPF